MGSAYIAPSVAAANREFIAAEANKEHIHRSLLEKLHEAEHELEVETAQLDIARQMQENAKKQLKIAQLSFTAGEIELMDFLRIQAHAQSALENAQESGIRFQRDIAFYNQAVGVMP
ncbi:MAG: TolC family protein [Candidatus Methanofishera endochildressiae]|uniref:TolC family protein n=1 Tax=Candidatus Methanofishera endochildressiae TaxID=2738884 RepID=A0A7Z0SDJ4_9GAMM|nr:TolC family protein [Candidatus Methanofishera endochildressiae]